MDNKFDLKDITFLILVRLDSIERLENILVTTQILISNFETSIILWECSPYNNGILERLLDSKVEYTFQKNRDPVLFRTKFLNRMAKTVHTPYIAVWDADVIAPSSQIIETVEMLRKGKADFVFPYEKQFLDISFVIRRLYMQQLNMELLFRNMDVMKALYSPNPVGGAFFCNLELFFDVGMENEKFYGWGVEDGERCCRWEKNGYRIKRVKGPLFHLTHPRGVNSTQESQQGLFIVKKREYYASGRIKRE